LSARKAKPVQPGSARWTELVREGIARDGNRNWFLGDAALEIAPMGENGTHNGAEENLRQFADEVGIQFATLNVYRKVAAAWPPVNRITGTSWRVHHQLMGHQELISEGMTVSGAAKALGHSNVGRTGPRATAEDRAAAAAEFLADPDVAAALDPAARAELAAIFAGEDEGPFNHTLYCKYCYKNQQVRPGDGVWECVVCGHGLVPIDSETVPAAMREAVAPVFPAGLTAEDAREAVAAMPPQDRAELAKAALADETAAELTMADPQTREDTFRAVGRVAEQRDAHRSRPQPSGPTPAEAAEDEHWQSLGSWQQVSEALKAEAVHLQSSELLAGEDRKFAGVILGYIARTRSQLDLIESIVSGGGVSDEALAKLLDSDA
jgi:hypothetical protein